jgi:hypothetical protein
MLDTLDTNKLMAKFMGFTYFPVNYAGVDRPEQFVAGWKRTVGDSNFVKHNTMRNILEKEVRYEYLCRNHHQLMYDKDWGALYEVIDKIEKMGWVFHCAKFSTDERYSATWLKNTCVHSEFTCINISRIKAAHKAVGVWLETYQNL